MLKETKTYGDEPAAWKRDEPVSTAEDSTPSIVDPASQHSTNIGSLPAYANSVFCHTSLPSSKNTNNGHFELPPHLFNLYYKI